MDHPNIAKVLDAGATETGRPYFVMELVRGIRITDYCDQNSLTTKERLDLFIKVCQAVQHAHQKGIIHRDIKPSNILVTLHDGVPVPKIIDFGIAKATRAGADRENRLYPAPAIHRDTRLHESGAGGDERAGHRHPERHLQPGGVALRTADRPTAVRSQGIALGRTGRDAAYLARSRADASFHAPEHHGHNGCYDHRQIAETGRLRSGQSGSRRSGLDRDEMSGERPHAAL